MRFWVDKEQEKKPDDEWKDAYVFSINRKKYSTIFTNITDSWYRMDQMQIPAIYEDLFIIGLSIFALDKRVSRRRFKDCWTRDINVSIPVLEYDKWKTLSFDKRMEVLQQLENEVAQIAHRPPCIVVSQNLGEGHLGFYEQGSNCITINENYIKSTDCYDAVLDTLIHEGRHAYQDYNLNVRETHPRHGDISNWNLNELHGYQDVEHCGFKAYQLQPVESDARAFAEDVLNHYQDKIA